MKTMQKLRYWSAALFFVMTVGGTAVAISVPETSFAAPAPASQCDGSSRLLTFPTWYRGLLTPDCNDIRSPSSLAGGLSEFIWTIVLNVIEIMLQAVGYACVGFIIAGGFRYIVSAGSPDGMVKARKTITNAVVGLVISIFSVAIVNVVAGALK
jgi:hypothetical protein